MNKQVRKTCRFALRKLSQIISVFCLGKERRLQCREFFDDKIIALYKDDIQDFIDAYPDVWSEEKTINHLIENRSSICRFGDGEFKLIIGERHKAFQDLDDKLNERLLSVLASNQPMILIGINNIQNYKSIGRVWRKFIIRIGKPVLTLLDKERFYPSSQVFRKLPRTSRNDFVSRVSLIKKIWDGRKILFIVGVNSRFFYEDELFNNAESIEYVYGPAKNAFAEYEAIYDKVLAYDKSEYLVIVVLGPTATIMAYDLALEGYQAIDFGQMPSTYRRAKKELFGDADILLPELLP